MNKLIRGNLYQRFLMLACLLAANLLHAEPPLDLRIVIDISGEVRGSMPANQHLDAVAMLLDQLPEGSMAGVWTFGKYTNHLVTYGRVDAQWHALADASLPTIRSVASWRDISRALEDASFDKARRGSAYRRVVLLLSGGGINISDDPAINSEAQQRLLAQQVGPIRDAGIAIHTIALDGGEGMDFMSSLAKEGNGLFFAVKRPEHVHAAIARFADSLSPGNSIPIVDDGFAIDTAVDRFSALLVGDPGNLAIESPSGKLITLDSTIEGISRHDGTHHVRIDVETPEMGRWRLQGSAGAGSRIYVESSQVISLEPLRDRYVSGENIALAVNAPVPAATYQTPVEVTLEAVGFAGAETFIQQLQPDPVNRGRYILEIPGLVRADNYLLNVTLRALDYSRVVTHPLQIHELLDLDVQAHVEAGESFYTLTARAADTELDPDQSGLSVKVTDSAGEMYLATLQRDQGGWRFNVADDGVSSEYRLDLALVGKTISGRAVSYTPRPLIITLPERPGITGAAAPAEPRPDALAKHIDLVADNAKPVPAVAAENAGQSSSLLIVWAAVCIVIGGGLTGVYLWLRRRAPYRIDLTRDAAAYRLANNISIVRIQEPGRPFQEVVANTAAGGGDQRTGSIELRVPDTEGGEPDVSLTEKAGSLPLLEDIVPEDTFLADAAGDELAAQDVLPEDIGSGLRAANEFTPDELVPEDMVSRGMEEVTRRAGEGEPGASGAKEEPASEAAVLEAAALEKNVIEDVIIEDAIDELMESTSDNGDVPSAEQATAEAIEAIDEPLEQLAEEAPANAVISITRLEPEPDLVVEEPEEVAEELPDFETVDDALAEEIAADTALIEETELATEWDNVALLSARSGKLEAVDRVAEELGGEDPFADYRAEYEATHGK